MESKRLSLILVQLGGIFYRSLVYLSKKYMQIPPNLRNVGSIVSSGFQNNLYKYKKINDGTILELIPWVNCSYWHYSLMACDVDYNKIERTAIAVTACSHRRKPVV